MRKTFLGLLLLVVFQNGFTEDLKVVRACSLDLPPHTMLNDNNQPDGFATRVLQQVVKDLSWSLQFHYMPWLRVVYMSKAGECDIAYTVLKRGDYERFLYFPKTTIHERTNIFVVRKETDISYSGNLESFMRSYRIGMYQDKAVNDAFEKLRYQPWARIDLAHTPDMNLRKLLAGRIDAAIENSFTAAYELRKLNQLNQVRFLKPALNHTSAYFTFPKAGKLTIDQINAFDKALSDFKLTDTYGDLLTFYEGQWIP